MRQVRYALLVSGLVLATSAAARADDAAEARALVDRAVQAQGGAERLAKFPAVTGKLKGTYYGLGDGVAFTGEFAAQGADRNRLVIEAETGGQKLRLVQVLNGERGWVQVNDDTEELDKEALAEAREQAYVEWVATLVPLRDRKRFSFSPLGEIKIDGRPAAGVRVSSAGRIDVNLYFDKATGLLAKTETRSKEDGEEVTEEALVGEYKEVQGMKQATRLTIRRDGQLYMKCEVTDYRLAERLDATLFAKP
jgi:hypothetical protein